MHHWRVVPVHATRVFNTYIVLLRIFAARQARLNLRRLATRVANRTMPKGLPVKKQKKKKRNNDQPF